MSGARSTLMQMPEGRHNTPCSLNLHTTIMKHHYHAMQSSYVLEETLIIMYIYLHTHVVGMCMYNIYGYTDMNAYVCKSQ